MSVIMRIPLSLIGSFIPLDVPLEKICDTLTLLGIEVDGVLRSPPSFEGVIVAEILSAKPHPNGSKLTIAEIDDGKERLQIVCAAPNCRPGIKTAFAPIGSTVTDSDGKKRTLEKATLRGVDSFGMLCSASDLHIWKDPEGILELPLDWKNGTPLAPLLSDPVLEISLTPNLGHCLNALGLSRELSAALQIPFKEPHVSPPSSGPLPLTVRVEDPQLCPRYMCRMIENVKIGPSPFWLQKELLSAGMTPIYNAVDVTNYIMLKWGQPLHAFDADKLEGGKIAVQTAKKEESFMALDGVKRDIPVGTLLIADEKKPVAIAGVIGGENSAISLETQNIVLEAAFFDPMTVRRGAKKMGVRTESVLRFEKGIDPNGVPRALEEASRLLVEVCGGKMSSHVIDLYQETFPPKKISSRPARINQLLGTELSEGEIASLYHRLGFKTHVHKNGTLEAEVPSYRFDLNEEIDLVEEVARLYGYNNIDTPLSRSAYSPIPHDPLYLFERELRRRATALGLQELLTSDLISPKLSSLAPLPDISLLKASSAKTEEYSILRPSLLPGLVQVVKNNLDQTNLTLCGFEIGHIHFEQQGEPVEQPMIGLIMTGDAHPLFWGEKARSFDFFDLKGILETLFEGLKVPISFIPSGHLSFHPGRQASLSIGNQNVGSLGEVHPALLAKMDIKQRVYFAELNLTSLLSHAQKKRFMTPIPQFPSSERDWTLPLTLRYHDLLQIMHAHKSPLLEKIELIDLYHPEGAVSKNGTFRFTYRDPLKTIASETVEKEHAQFVAAVSSALHDYMR